MTIDQVLLSNTFNEFRVTVNEIANTVNDLTANVLSGELVVNTLVADSVDSNTITANTGTIDSFSANTIAANTGTIDSFSANTIVVGGNVTASFFVGDGSQLTNAGATITDDSTSATEKFLLFTDLTSGTATSVNVDSTQLKYTPSTGNLAIPSVETDLIIGNTVFQSTGQIEIPVGSTAERSSSNVGSFRYNSELDTFEGYGAEGWGEIGGGGGATGGGSDEVFFENEQTANNTYEITPGKNAMTVGPLTIASGVTIQIPDGTRFVII
jgi:hypothetical protein